MQMQRVAWPTQPFTSISIRLQLCNTSLTLTLPCFVFFLHSREKNMDGRMRVSFMRQVHIMVMVMVRPFWEIWKSLFELRRFVNWINDCYDYSTNSNVDQSLLLISKTYRNDPTQRCDSGVIVMTPHSDVTVGSSKSRTLWPCVYYVTVTGGWLSSVITVPVRYRSAVATVISLRQGSFGTIILTDSDACLIDRFARCSDDALLVCSVVLHTKHCPWIGIGAWRLQLHLHSLTITSVININPAATRHSISI